MDTYRESILAELRSYNVFEYNLFREAKCAFPQEDVMELTMPDSIVAQGKTEELLRILEKIFCERCGMSLKIQVIMEEASESNAMKNSELRIRQEVDAVIERVSAGRKEKKEEAAARQAAKENRQETSGGKEKGPGKADRRRRRLPQGAVFPGRTGKKAVFPGAFPRESGVPTTRRGLRRDFEEASTPIEQILGEMGEVVIRGQISSLDKREIRNEKTIIMLDITDFTDTITVKMFARNDQVPEILEGVKKGGFYKIKGVTTIDKFDGQLTIGSVNGIKKIPDFRLPGRILLRKSGWSFTAIRR